FIQQRLTTDDSPAAAPVVPGLPLSVTPPQQPVTAVLVDGSDTRNAATNIVDDAISLSANACTAVNTCEQPSAAMDRVIERVVSTVRAGAPHALSRASRALSQPPLAPHTPDTMAKLHELHPRASASLPLLPPNLTSDLVQLDVPLLTRVITDKCHNGAAPGPSGWTGSHLRVLWERLDSSARKGLELFIRDICNGVFSGSVKNRLLACALIPVSKPNGNGIRPIAIGEVFIK